MAQSIKIQTGFSEKVSENFNSTQHSISLEMDTVINGSTREIEDASQKLFALCRKIVSAQRGVNVDSLLNSEIPPTPASALAATQTAPAAPTATPQQSAHTGNSSSQRLASSKQIRLILDLAKKVGYSFDEIRDLPHEFKKETFETLSVQQASQLIEKLSHKKAA